MYILRTYINWNLYIRAKGWRCPFWAGHECPDLEPISEHDPYQVVFIAKEGL